MSTRGIVFGEPKIDRARLRDWKASVVAKLTGGLAVLAKQRKIEVVRGVGRFVGANVLEVKGASGTERIRFEQCIIAAGSEAMRLPGLPQDPRIIDSADALELPQFSGPMLIVGCGIIGLEMACVFDALGTRVSLVELTKQLMPGVDADLLRPLERRIRARYQQVLLGTKVAGVAPEAAGLRDNRSRGGRRPRLRSRLHSGRPPDAHQRAAHLRSRRYRGSATARPQGHARGQGRGGSRRRREALR